MAKSTSTSAPPPTQSRAPATPAAVVSAQLVPVKASDIMPRLLSELQKADDIIIAMLNAMTTPQKSKVHVKLDAANISGEGMTRHHERRAAIDAGEAALAAPAATACQSDPAQGATDATIADSQCPIFHATAALDSVEWGISVVDEIASMVNGIQALAELPLDGLTLAKLKKRMTSLNRLALLTVRFADDRSDILGEIRDQADEIVEKLNLSLSECWRPVRPGTMPPAEVSVIAWDNTIGVPCAVFFDPSMDCWISLFDCTKIYEGEITHWRHCNAPDGSNGEGATS
jgi:hypothetical protein